MEWVMVVLAGGAAGSHVVWKLKQRADERRDRAAELDLARTLAEEDVRAFGEQLERLGVDVAASDVAHIAKQHHQTAIDIHADAQSMVAASATAGEISDLIATLARGHHAAACVRAHLAGEPVPESTLPCFFNPQHGQSSRKVTWTSPRRGTHRVPACARCATRVAVREKPDVRTISISGHRAPYWEAGAALHPYCRGYFPGTGASSSMAWLYDSRVVGPAAAGGADAPSFGAHGGREYGGFDTGSDSGTRP
ncbi:hypothetical protein [Nocardioides sp.]|uniref:hypothetical protein n=1 Tax=Nocardioides sp. TaxID=35761 RepID=UPI002ED26530